MDFSNPWFATVITNSPSIGLYVALVGVYEPVPCFTISNTAPNEELTLFTSVIDADIDEVIEFELPK